jgi:hypothetical protein
VEFNRLAPSQFKYFSWAENVILYGVGNPRRYFLCFGNRTPTKTITYMNIITNMKVIVMPTG